MWRRSHRSPGSLTKHRTAALASVSFLFAASILILSKNKDVPMSSSGDPVPKRDIFHPVMNLTAALDTPSPFALPALKWDTFDSSVRLNPFTAFRNGTDVIWQVPSVPKGALFIAHGCNGRASNFWDRSPVCPNCVGLPEERFIVLHALDKGFAVLAVSSLGRCWSFGKEVQNVKGIIEWWLKDKGLEKLPLVALGASSGGYFVSALATRMNFSSIALMIAEGVFDEMTDIPNGYPSTLFVHMPKDRARERMVMQNMKRLKEKGVDTKEIRCMEFPLTPNFLSDRIPGLDQAMSVSIFQMFRKKDFVDEKGFMRRDGRATEWRQVLEGKDSMVEWADHIQEELNLAYGYHEMTSLPMVDILSWFQSHTRIQDHGIRVDASTKKLSMAAY